MTDLFWLTAMVYAVRFDSTKASVWGELSLGPTFSHFCDLTELVTCLVDAEGKKVCVQPQGHKTTYP